MTERRSHLDGTIFEAWENLRVACADLWAEVQIVFSPIVLPCALWYLRLLGAVERCISGKGKAR